MYLLTNYGENEVGEEGTQDFPDLTDENEPDYEDASESELKAAGAGIVPNDALNETNPLGC